MLDELANTCDVIVFEHMYTNSTFAPTPRINEKQAEKQYVVQWVIDNSFWVMIGCLEGLSSKLYRIQLHMMQSS